MTKHFRHRRKPAGRRFSAWLGLRHTTKKYVFLYLLCLIILVLLFPLFTKFWTAFKKNYGRGYGYNPRDVERSEKLREAKRPIPFQPKGAWQYGESAEEKEAKKEKLTPYF